jgi:hypothetical protein
VRKTHNKTISGLIASGVSAILAGFSSWYWYSLSQLQEDRRIVLPYTLGSWTLNGLNGLNAHTRFTGPIKQIVHADDKGSGSHRLGEH